MCSTKEINAVVRNTILTDKGVDWIVANGIPIIDGEFTGYICQAELKYNAWLLVGCDGGITIFNPQNQKFKKKFLKTFVDTLYKADIMKSVKDIVFPEYERGIDIPFDRERAIYLDNMDVGNEVYS